MLRIAIQATRFAEPVAGVPATTRVVVRISPVVITGQASG
jgi:hypothetical protein